MIDIDSERDNSPTEEARSAGIFRASKLALHVARYEIRSRYARSVLGSFWITLQQGLFIGVAGLVFPAIFNVSLTSYIPHFAISLLFWNFMAASLLETMDALPANGPMVKDRGFSPEVFLLASIIRNVIVSAHALPISVLAIVICQSSSMVGLLLALPGLALFMIAVGSLSYAAGMISARYRDLKRASESFIQLAFLVTPILWKPSFVGDRATLVVDLNPLAHLFNVWRQPLLGEGLSPLSLAVSGLTAIACLALAAFARRQRRHVALWI